MTFFKTFFWVINTNRFIDSRHNGPKRQRPFHINIQNALFNTKYSKGFSCLQQSFTVLILYRYIGPATPTIVVAILLFAIPFELKVSGTVVPKKRMAPLMDWDTVHKKMPWNLVFLMGGGFALAHACEVCSNCIMFSYKVIIPNDGNEINISFIKKYLKSALANILYNF